MKAKNIIRLALFALGFFLVPHSMKAQDEKEKEKLMSESKEAKADLIKTDPTMSKLFLIPMAMSCFQKMARVDSSSEDRAATGLFMKKAKQSVRQK